MPGKRVSTSCTREMQTSERKADSPSTEVSISEYGLHKGYKHKPEKISSLRSKHKGFGIPKHKGFT